ncbi:MAG: hypothetical protein M1836_000809 [Candelina mexicana]|nr:MAG: hypothetical protein M1836_000809 [Candelina mexicana]
MSCKFGIPMYSVFLVEPLSESLHANYRWLLFAGTKYGNPLPVTINGFELSSLAGTGAGDNIVDGATARKLAVSIDRGPRTRKRFKLGNGTSVESTGCFTTCVSFVNGAPTPTECLFYVLQKCPAPVIMGRRFLAKTRTMTTEFKHRFQERTSGLERPSRICYIGGTSSRLPCMVDGKDLLANPDTGSEINVMSLAYAKKHGYYKKRSNRQLRVIFGDGSQSKTLGAVTAEVALVGRSYLEELHILPRPPCDILLGEGILNETDALSVYDDHFVSPNFEDVEELSLIRVLNFLEKMRRVKRQPTLFADDTQFEKDRAERHRHDREIQRIRSLPPFERQAEWERERIKGCDYNLSRYTELVDRLQASDLRERRRRGDAQRHIAALIAQHRSPAIAHEESMMRHYDESRQEKVELLLRSPPHPLYPAIPPWP